MTLPIDRRQADDGGYRFSLEYRGEIWIDQSLVDPGLRSGVAIADDPEKDGNPSILRFLACFIETISSPADRWDSSLLLPLWNQRRNRRFITSTDGQYAGTDHGKHEASEWDGPELERIDDTVSAFYHLMTESGSSAGVILDSDKRTIPERPAQCSRPSSAVEDLSDGAVPDKPFVTDEPDDSGCQ